MRILLGSVFCICVGAIELSVTPNAVPQTLKTPRNDNVRPLISLSECEWDGPEYPHISDWNADRLGRTDIKVSATGECAASSDPVNVTAQVYLEVLFPAGPWVTYVIGTPITKNLLDTDQIWRRGELFALATPCVPGTYRGRLIHSAELEGGISGVTGPDYFSAPRYIDCKGKQVSMVIDDTGSMTAELGSVKSALASYINSQPPDEYTSWNLTTFKDSPTNVGTTTDRTQILSWVNALYASGGGDCPEDSLGGITTGLAALGTDPNANKQMLVATDASSHYRDVDSIIAQAQANGVKVNVLLAGDCSFPTGPSTSLRTAAVPNSPTESDPSFQIASAPSLQANAVSDPLSSQVVLKRIANETGGQYFFIPNGTPEQYLNAVGKIFAVMGGQITDVSANVKVTQTGFGRNRATGMWTADMTVMNAGTTLIAAPVSVVLSNLTSGVTMTNKSGLYGIAPYITVSTTDLAAGASVTVSIQFANPTNGFIGFTPKTLSGSF